MHPLAALLHGIFQPGFGGPDIVKYIVDNGCSKEVWRKPNCWRQTPPPMMAWNSLPALFLHKCMDITATVLTTFTNSLSFSTSPTLSLPVATQAAPQIPVGNCTYFYEYLAGNAIARAAFAARNTLCNSTDLRLNWAGIGPAEIAACLPAIRQMMNITAAYFNKATIGDPEVSLLLQALVPVQPQLPRLEFGETGLSDQSSTSLALHLPKMINAYRLNFFATKITDIGALALLPAMKQMPKLVAVLLSGLNPRINATTQATINTALPGIVGF